MKKKAIIYLHGFNSASLDLHGNLLVNKEKLAILQDYCQQKEIHFFTPNVDYRDFMDIVENMLFEWNQLLDKGYEVMFMGSSMGGFSSEYLAMKTGAKAIMINPVVFPTELLIQFIGVTENYETSQPYQWKQQHCDQFIAFEHELRNCSRAIDRVILLDMADELIDSRNTADYFQNQATIQCYEGGSHSFEHMKQALSVVDQVLFQS